jgi:lauroyl/myristoyl acyltransferase
MLQIPYTIGQDILDDTYHVGVTRHILPRNLAACFPDIFDEMQQSFEENLALTGSGIGDDFL